MRLVDFENVGRSTLKRERNALSCSHSAFALNMMQHVGSTERRHKRYYTLFEMLTAPGFIMLFSVFSMYACLPGEDYTYRRKRTVFNFLI